MREYFFHLGKYYAELKIINKNKAGEFEKLRKVSR